MLVPTGASSDFAPLSWVVFSEIFPNRVRGKAMSLATCAMFASSYAVVNVFPMMMDCLKTRFGNPGGIFLIFAGICLLCSLFVGLLLPETKDRTLEEIGEIRACASSRASGPPPCAATWCPADFPQAAGGVAAAAGSTYLPSTSAIRRQNSKLPSGGT